MLKRSEMEFQAGTILKKEMLQELYDYPRIAVESLFSGFSDGILYGMEWKETGENKHVICSGALKFKGNIYFLNEDMDVEQELGGELEVDGSYRLCFAPQEAKKPIKAKTDYYLKLVALQDGDYKQVEENAFWYAYIRFSGEKKIEIIAGDNATKKYGIPGLNATSDGYDFQLPNWLLRQQILPVLKSKNNKHPLDYLLLEKVYGGHPISVSFINMYLNELGKENIAFKCKPLEVLDQLRHAINALTLTVSVESSVKPDCVEEEPTWSGGGLL